MNRLEDKDLREALRRLEARRKKPEVSAGFSDRVMRETAPKRSRTPWAALAVAAGIVAAILLAWPQGRTGRSEGRQQSLSERLSESPGEAKDVSERQIPLAPTAEKTRSSHRNKRFPRQKQPVSPTGTTVGTADSLDYYISKIERELAQVDDSLYIESIQRVMHADERLQRIVNSYILHELHKEDQPQEATIINHVTTEKDEE